MANAPGSNGTTHGTYILDFTCSPSDREPTALTYSPNLMNASPIFPSDEAAPFVTSLSPPHPAGPAASIAPQYHESNGHGPNENSSNNSDWLSTLHIACFRGHSKIVEILLERDVDIDERDGSGRTAIQLATMNGHESVVRLLLSHGAKINTRDSLGCTPIHWAALQKHEGILRLFLDAGADVDITDVNGWCVLHAAVERGFEVGLVLLLSHGADLSLKARKCESWKRLEPSA